MRRAVRRDARRHHERAAVGQRPRVCAVVIHHGDLLAPRGLRPALGHVGDAAVEIPRLAGQPGVDRVRRLVRQPAPASRRSLELEPLAERGLTEHVPEPEAHLHPVAGRHDRAGDQSLGVDRAPVGEPHRRVEIRDAPDMGVSGDLAEQPRSDEVVHHHLGDPRREIRRAGVGDETGRRERHRLDHAVGDLDPERRLRQRRERSRKHGGRHGQEQVSAEAVHHETIPSGLKTTSRERHWAYLSRGMSL